MELLGNKIRMLRKTKNLTQQELAQKLSVSSQAVSKWERNLSVPDISMLPGLARFFGITMDELFNYRLDALTYKERFIRFMADNDVLRFGEFKLKSGRISPYFIAPEHYASGSQLTKIGEFFTDCIRQNNIHTDLLLANTIRESHLVCAVSMVMYSKYGIDLGYCINNEVGTITGSNSSVTVLKDTFCSGDTFRGIMRETKDRMGLYPHNVILSVDRMERGLCSDLTSTNEIRQEFGINVFSIVTVDDIISAMENGVISGMDYVTPMKEYRERYRGK